MDCIDCSKELEEHELQLIRSIKDVPLCFQCLNRRPDLLNDVPDRVVTEAFEGVLRELATQQRLDVHRPAFLHDVPTLLEDELPEFRGTAGMPDFFVSGASTRIIEFIQDNGIAEIDDLKSEHGVFVEVKYALSVGSGPKYQDTQTSVFPQLQDAGFDVLIFRGYRDHYWFERYAANSNWVFCQECGNKIEEGHDDPCFCSECSNTTDSIGQKAVAQTRDSDELAEETRDGVTTLSDFTGDNKK